MVCILVPLASKVRLKLLSLLQVCIPSLARLHISWTPLTKLGTFKRQALRPLLFIFLPGILPFQFCQIIVFSVVICIRAFAANLSLQVLTAIGNFCICSIVVGMFVEIIVMYPIQHRAYRPGIDNLLVLLIGGIPIAMPTVLSVTMAIGSHRLAQQVCGNLF